ncbi:MAG: hypothetical protein WCL46_07695 [Chlorobium sp.]|jgi:hypothetical protein
MKKEQLDDFILPGEVSGQPESTPHVTPHVGAHDEAHDTVAFIKRQQSKQEHP